MSKLIDELKKDHLAIVETINKLSSFATTPDKWNHGLFIAKSSILEHLKKEDEQLYPVLNNAAKSDTDLKQTLDLFAKDMKQISKEVLEFFDKYSKGGSGMEFARKLGRVLAILMQRQNREENVIFRKYNELNQ